MTAFKLHDTSQNLFQENRRLERLYPGDYRLHIPGYQGKTFRITRNTKGMWMWRCNNHSSVTLKGMVDEIMKLWNEALGLITVYAHNHYPCSLYRAYYDKSIVAWYSLVQWELWNFICDTEGHDPEKPFAE